MQYISRVERQDSGEVSNPDARVQRGLCGRLDGAPHAPHRRQRRDRQGQRAVEGRRQEPLEIDPVDIDGRQ